VISRDNQIRIYLIPIAIMLVVLLISLICLDYQKQAYNELINKIKLEKTTIRFVKSMENLNQALYDLASTNYYWVEEIHKETEKMKAR